MKSRKLILYAFLSLILASGLSAQVTNNWTSTIKARHLPPTANIPTVAALTDPHKLKFALALDGATYDNASDSTAFAGVGAATKAELDSNWLVQIWAIDTTLDITARTVLTRVTRKFDTFTYGDMDEQYGVATDIFWVEGVFEYVKEPD